MSSAMSRMTKQAGTTIAMMMVFPFGFCPMLVEELDMLQRVRSRNATWKCCMLQVNMQADPQNPF
jgi:hypothetical protein